MKNALVIGSGPAGLMAAQVLAQAGISVTVCEAKPSLGRKFLMAGKSGLNITKAEDATAFQATYTEARPWLAPMLSAFGADAVQAWAADLAQPLFTGTTGRVFPEAMKASPLLRAWLARLALCFTPAGAGPVLRMVRCSSTRQTGYSAFTPMPRFWRWAGPAGAGWDQTGSG